MQYNPNKLKSAKEDLGDSPCQGFSFFVVYLVDKKSFREVLCDC